MSEQTQYDARYFAYQRRIGEFGGWANSPKFTPFLNPDDCVIDFGCGGGYLPSNLRQRTKAGIEVNPVAREQASALGIRAFRCAADVPFEADIVISNHALEHCQRPLDEIEALTKRLKPGGRMLFYVPSETSLQEFYEDDPNHHLYTWSPMNLGNLFKAAGLRVVFANAYHRRWPPFYQAIARFGGRTVFDFAALAYGYLKRHRISQVRCLAVLDENPSSTVNG